jgi:REP element-mobilizing transposase RayT
MARKLRLEFPGACYHVINRGNYRRDVFASARTKSAFIDALFAACERSGWLLHAFVVMRNHFHLALTTPQGNLVAGMHWLLSTFANRFNRLRDERGHLFQGRFRSILVEEGDPLAQVCHYIHLNPVRAGIVSVAHLREYRASSYPWLWTPRQRPAYFQLQDALLGAGGLPDIRAGWQCYADYLQWQDEEGPAGRSKAYVNLSRGWVIGGSDFKAVLLRDHAVAVEARAWEEHGAREIRELRWHSALAKALAVAEKNPKDILRAAKSAPWKLAIATALKQHTQSSNGWLSRHLQLGHAHCCSSNLTRFKRHSLPNDPLSAKLARIFAA